HYLHHSCLFVLFCYLFSLLLILFLFFFFLRLLFHLFLHSFPTRRSSDLIYFFFMLALPCLDDIWQDSLALPGCKLRLIRWCRGKLPFDLVNKFGGSAFCVKLFTNRVQEFASLFI